MGLKTYSEIVYQRHIAALFVALWLVLLGIEFTEDMGLIEYNEPEMDQSVEAALTSLGEAIKISDDLQLATPCFAFAYPVAYFPLLENQEASLQFIGEGTGFVKADIPIYTLHQVFLI